MTEVKFFFNVDHKIDFACRLAKKAYDGGKKLIVYAPDPAVADHFNRQLWCFSQLSFVPHVHAGHPLAAQTPIIIATDEAALPHHEALLNLGAEPPPFFTRFEQLREVVGLDDEDRAQARERLKFYKARGFDIQNHDMKDKNG